MAGQRLILKTLSHIKFCSMYSKFICSSLSIQQITDDLNCSMTIILARYVL